MSDRNQAIIDEFRANDGVVGGYFSDSTLLLLHHTGAKSGTHRVSPLVYQDLDGSWAIFASMGGAPSNPAWYHNLLANPSTTIEVGTDKVDVTAREATGEERDRIWSAQKAWSAENPTGRPQFGEYEVKTDRVIPVIVLEAR